MTPANHNDRNYNRPVTLPYSASAEQLWRTDHTYDLIVVLGYDFTLAQTWRYHPDQLFFQRLDL